MEFLFIVVSAAIVITWITWQLFKHTYYSGGEFQKLKRQLNDYATKCNELNEHIEQLKTTYADIKKKHYGDAKLNDASKFNFRRPEQVKAKKSEYIYECSASICKNADRQPFKYLCKYFNIQADEETLAKFEHVLNQFAAVEDGKKILQYELKQIEEAIAKKIPFMIRALHLPQCMKKLGFQPVDVSDMYVPVYTFRYISPGGNKTTHCDIPLNVKNLNDFVQYLAEKIDAKNSQRGQRALMTSKLREQIKKRDGYACKTCAASVKKEPNLLLEVDHIIPISKGGKSTVDNLQTLCWKCNRTKGTKLQGTLRTKKLQTM